ncbi:putative homeobox protein knotted-1-like LET12-like [Capsicum annuum]|uniref:Uncharacterized protein n=1 Tax=Capsicum annuum TaxID=4072 RepID=A0A1U8HH85_CAPAN|nr:uncharacterized protein LOC107877682 [Capsicum annuum]KAF3654264.1 putative homeobox protein knotted-1-like LET12-like [Capsicum annuum]KAF3659926.1 putative homeobox protein knotted-1-like LET12-like [Capsicum annuum]PHT75436.1 hypothetical protein T459_18958 [Capsicum annuum]
MMNNTYSPIRETPREGTESYYHEEPSSSIWSACFPCFQSKEVEANSLLHDSSSSSSSWMVNKLKELKEYSEVVAGPKWKNMVRKIGKYFNNNPNKKRTTQFQYDSDSYALNFANDDGNGGDDGLFRNFSSRFAAPFSASAVANNNNNNNPQRNDGL